MRAQRRTLLSTVLLGTLLIAGCTGRGPAPASSAQPGPLYAAPEPEGAFAWNETGRSLVLNTRLDYVYGVDVLCLHRGGPHLSRANGHVLPGAGHLDVKVHVHQGAAYMGFRIGYVVDSNGAAHAADSDKPITWLPAVYQGVRSFRIPVPSDTFETDGDPQRWHFYHTINPDKDELCYTGLATGKSDLRIEAVRKEVLP